MKELLGTLYFTPVKDEDTGKLASRYEGVVVAFIVRRDDGVEFEVRQDIEQTAGAGHVLKWDDLPLLKVGQPIIYSKQPAAKYHIVRVYPTFGDVWIADDAGVKKAVKWTELKRPE